MASRRWSLRSKGQRWSLKSFKLREAVRAYLLMKIACFIEEPLSW